MRAAVAAYLDRYPGQFRKLEEALGPAVGRFGVASLVRADHAETAGVAAVVGSLGAGHQIPELEIRC